MGGCVSGDRPGRKKQQGQFKEIELKLLKLMFDDLACRTPNEFLSRQNFYIFFHINVQCMSTQGLWGQEIFNSFDKNNSGELEFDEFKDGVELLVKGNFRKKVNTLFHFYDIDKSNNISYPELLKMVCHFTIQLYSYPKEELKNMFKDPNFRNSMAKHERQYMLQDKNMMKPILEVEEDHSVQEEVPKRVRRKSEQLDDHVYAVTPEAQKMENGNGFQGLANKLKDQFLFPKRKQSKRPPPLQIASYQRMSSQNDRMGKSPGLKKGVPTGSVAVGKELQTATRKIKVTSNISLLVKKYAKFLFEEEGLDIEKDKMTEDQFAKIIANHGKIFASYFQGFHNYIWEVEESETTPEFIRNTSWVDGTCFEFEEKENILEERFIKFYKNTIFVLRRPTSILPQAIKNLEGLHVEEYMLEKKHLYGFILKHRDGVYPERAYLFKDVAVKDEWMRHLKFYKKYIQPLSRTSVQEMYIFQSKIGAGNFSIVYKGTNKANNQSVAIKEIEKFKLTAAERDVIQHECAILQHCHHPGIIQFIDRFETKTHLYIITELMDEGDLDDYVKEKMFLEEYEASFVLKQLIEAIDHLNKLSLIHRDLKPENIMIRKRKDADFIEKIKIIDFGFAIYKSALKTMSQKEKYVGTPNYVAPEILRTEDFDEAVDNFSIGVIMYFMLSGNLPFDSPYPQEITKQTIECNLSFDNLHWSNVSPAAKDLMSKLICPKHLRITLKDVLKHSWLNNMEELKKYKGKNSRNSYR